MSPQSSLFVLEGNEDLNGASVSADTSPQLTSSTKAFIPPIYRPAPKDILREREEVRPTSTTTLNPPAPEEEDEEEDLLQLLRWARRRSPYPPRAVAPSTPEEEDQKNKQQEPARSRRHPPHPRDTLTLSAPNKERELHPHLTSNSFAHDGGEEQEKMINRAPCHKRRRHRSPSPRRASKASATKDNGQEESEAGRVRKRRGVRGKEEKNGNNGNIGGRSRRGFGGKEGENGNNDNLGGRSRRGVGGKEEENGNNENLGGRSHRGVGGQGGENGNNENLGGHSHHHRKHHGVPPSLPANRRTWCLRCARYLAISPQFTCEFAGNANKCTRCAKWQDECVPVPPAEAPLLRNLLGLLRRAQVSTGEKAAEYHRQVQETARALSSPPPQQP